MSWMQQLFDTYEACAKNPEFLSGDDRLLPIYHTLQQAHIEVTLNENAECVDAKVIRKTETILPATEKSAGRTSGEEPHALADKIQYCGGDYADFGGQKKSYFASYIKELSNWCNSEHAHPKVNIVFNYLSKKKLVRDLISKGILIADVHQQLIDDWDTDNKDAEMPLLFKQLQKDPVTKKYDQGNALVRWHVQIPGDNQDATWQDQTVFDAWRDYCLSQGSEKGICHITGNTVSTATIHPRRIRNPGDGAKIISSPVDKTFYTYKGRFIEEQESCQIGAEVSQKAHNALRWLIARQGFKNGSDQVIVSWAVSGKDIPKLTDNSLDFLSDDSFDVDNESTYDPGQIFSIKLNKKISGYKQNLGSTEKIIVMGLDSATSGRISIIFYRELSGSDFLQCIENWHHEFAWLLYIFIQDKNSGSKKNIPVWRVCAPSPRDIAETAYGKNLDEKLKKATVERLLNCIVDGNPLPKDLLDSCFRRTNHRESMEHWEWQQSLGITCALFKGYYARQPQRRTYAMSLERERTNRDYLYGRLLAIAEQIESYALYKANEKRITNAERLMLRFSSRPCSTWKIIDESLRPYRDRLRVSREAGLLHYWEEEIEQACTLFNHDDFVSDKPLSGEYLLGYHCQKHYRKPKTETTIELEDTQGE